MNKIVETDALVIRQIEYGENSNILRVFTRDLGKISILVRGVTRPKSSNRVLSQIFSYSNLKLKSGRNFYYINDGDLIDSFYDLRLDFEKLSYGLYILELIDKSMEMEQVNEDVFDMTLKLLKLLNVSTEDILKLITAYELKYISLIGFMPAIKECAICGSRELDNGKFSQYRGGVICRKCSLQIPDAYDLDIDDLQILKGLLYSKLEDLDKLKIKENKLKKIHNLLLGYILESIDRKGFNSLKILEEI